MSLPLVGFALAGGTGQRLAPLTTCPGGQIRSKALVSFLGRPIFAWQLAHFQAQGMEDCLLLARGPFNREPVRRHFGYRWGGVNLAYSAPCEDALDTGSADATLRNAQGLSLEHPLLVFPTDSLFTVNLEDLLHSHLASRADLTVGTVLRPDHEVAGRYGIALHQGQRVTEFVEKPTLSQLRRMGSGPWPTNSGIYVMNPEVLERIAHHPAIAAMRPNRLDFGLDLLPWMVAEGFRICHYDRMWVGDLGTLPVFLETMRWMLTHQTSPWDFERNPRHPWGARYQPNIHPTARVESSWISPGAVVGPHAHVSHSWLGDDVHLGEGARVIGSHIDVASVIGPHAHIQDSVLGEAVDVASHALEPTVIDEYSGIGDLAKVAAGSALHAAVLAPEAHWPHAYHRQTS